MYITSWHEDICRTWYYSQIYCLGITHNTHLILHTTLLTWYYSQASNWYYSHGLQHHHLNHMGIFVGLHTTHKYTVLILLKNNGEWLLML